MSYTMIRTNYELHPNPFDPPECVFTFEVNENSKLKNILNNYLKTFNMAKA